MSLPAADRAYRHTKSLILSGAAVGGAVLSEVAVADELGISRTPVHEAFLRLESENLLALAPRRGASVVPMAPDESRDVLEMREAIECSTARRALSAGPVSPEVLDEMHRNLAEQRETAGDGADGRFPDLDTEFHLILVRASRNATAVQFSELLRDRQHRLRRQLLQVGAEEITSALAEHELMAAAAGAGDADELCRLITAHIRRHRGVL
ncbi:GntR family transcriptional regulator [Cellulomonas triticagri]|uniref:GntR family transcriptional regulator n=1 Tax=Cellulomonas triticagri TaxID=2483352 RepID=A0A3M2JBJ2_9CELL|nr:GntR family transcriptional regulator [Cellulomonas triticagri]RMI09596.1 GntR family transcriptional regulator [Cellulomonas triticagri]